MWKLSFHSLAAVRKMADVSAIHAVIFDVDGTLLDTETLSSVVVNAELAKYNAAPIDWDLKRRIVGLPGPVWTDMVIKERELEANMTPNELLLTWEAKLHEICGTVKEIEGASAVVNKLRWFPIKLAVATSSRKDSLLHKAASHTDLFSSMEVVVCGDDPEVSTATVVPTTNWWVLSVHPSLLSCV